MSRMARKEPLDWSERSSSWPSIGAVLAAFAVLAASPGLQAVAFTGPPSFGAPVMLPSSGGDGEPGVAVGPDGAIYVVAPESATGVWRSTDGGASFLRVADSRGSSGDSDVALDANGVLYVADLFNNVPVSLSFDQGATFAFSTPTAANSASIDRQWLTAHGSGHVWTSWSDNGLLRSARSSDGGHTFTRSVAVPGDLLWSGDIVATSDTTLWIPWQDSGDGSLMLAKSTDGGATWASRLVAANPGFDDVFGFPGVAVDAGAPSTWSGRMARCRCWAAASSWTTTSPSSSP